MSTIPLARSTFATAAASTASSKSIVPTTWRALGGVGDERRGVRRPLGPGVEPRRRVRGAADRPGQAALAVHPLDLVGEQGQGRDGRGVVGLVLAGVVDRGRQVEEVGHPPAATRRSPRRGRARRATACASHRPPSEAKRLLRGEVVDVGLARRRPAGRRRRTSRRRATSASVVGARRRGAPAPSTPGRGLVVRPGVDVDARLGLGAGSVPGSPVDRRSGRRGTARCG